MANRIICIGRQFGSGGHEIAVKTANQLGIKVYERELIRLACEYGELSEKAMSAADEKATNPYLFQTVHEGNYHVLRGRPTSEVLFALQSHEIRRLAKREECVCVGRCRSTAWRGRWSRSGCRTIRRCSSCGRWISSGRNTMNRTPDRSGARRSSTTSVLTRAGFPFRSV